MEEKGNLNILVNRVIESGDRTAIKKLGKEGAAGIEAALKGMNGPYPTERHPIDIMDDFGEVFTEYAKFNIAGLLFVTDSVDALNTG